MANEKATAVKVVNASYTRDALAASKKYHGQRDVLMVVLKDGEAYTTTEVDKKIKEFTAKPVEEDINGQKDKTKEG